MLLRRIGMLGGVLITSIVLLAPAPASAVEILFAPPPEEAPPQRRLPKDPVRPARAPGALDIEYAAIKDDAQTALRLATRALEVSRSEYGQNDPRTIIPLSNRGTSLLRAGQALDAIKDFRKAIELAETEPSPRDPRLAEVHYGLGAAQYALGRWPAAIESFENGLQQHRVARGLQSAEQIDFLRALALSSRAMGDIKDATRWQQRRVLVAEQVHRADVQTLAWHYVNAGRWFRTVGDFDEALALHAKAVETIQRDKGPEASLLIGPLMDLAITGAVWEPGENSPATAFRYQPGVTLKRAYRLAMARTDGTPSERMTTLERVGDLHWLFGLRREALRAYAQAGEIAKEQGQASAFGVPAFLSFRPPQIPDAWRTRQGHVLAEFTVDSRGRARKVEIVEGLPPEFTATLGESLKTAIKTSKLRPRLDGGRPETTRDVRYRVVVPPSAQERRHG
ncbi:MAG: tetratricopeptide repeat protein [Panacagrimonas sp.]